MESKPRSASVDSRPSSLISEAIGCQQVKDVGLVIVETQIPVEITLRSVVRDGREGHGVLIAVVLVAALAAAYFWGFHGKKDQRAPEAPQTAPQQSFRSPALR